MFSLRRAILYLACALLLLALLQQLELFDGVRPALGIKRPEPYRLPLKDDGGAYEWANRLPHYPVESFTSLPPPGSRKLPRIQHRRFTESASEAIERRKRKAEVKRAFQRCWQSYRDYAWLQDELAPISKGGKSTFGGWAATLIDSLDLLWIMDLKEEFKEAVDAALTVDFSKTSSNEISVFETTIRYLGGFLAAYDLSGDRRLLDKTLELAHMLYAAFDTPNRMPILRWDFNKAAAADSEPQVADQNVVVAEIGSLTIEFTRLAQITHDDMWYDAVARIMDVFDAQQDSSALPGMWPISVNAQMQDFQSGGLFSLGAMADSLYEYFPKMYALLGGSDLYARLYNKSMAAAIQHSIYRPMLPDDADVLMATSVVSKDDGELSLTTEGQHLICFAGGMLALGGRLLGNESHVDIGRKLTDGCIWTYANSELGIMPESFTMLPCTEAQDKPEDANETASCRWDNDRYLSAVASRHPSDSGDIVTSQRLVKGFTSISNRHYFQRPEAIESVFVLYRITADRLLQEQAWAMFSAIQNHSLTDVANAVIADVTDPEAPKIDSMETFWTAETLKYFYLIFSDPDVISLDEWVLNTEAHPVKRVAPAWF